MTKVLVCWSNGPIDYLVCVADADRAHECFRGIERPPAHGATEVWGREADKTWTATLRNATSLCPSQIAGFFLRWNQESLLIAAHDVDGVLQRLGCRNLRAVRDHLRSCTPSPLETSDASFIDLFRKSGRCLEDMLKAAGFSAPHKGSSYRADALEEASRVAIDRLCERVPDLDKLAAHISSLAG